MRFFSILFLCLACLPVAALAQPVPSAGAGFVVEQTYWVKPGREMHFISLFKKIRVPVLQAGIKDGSVLWMRLSKPQFNASNEQWDLRVTVAWRDADSAMERIPKAGAQDTHRLAMEQQIMEELIVERNDIPVQEWSVP